MAEIPIALNGVMEIAVILSWVIEVVCDEINAHVGVINQNGIQISPSVVKVKQKLTTINFASVWASIRNISAYNHFGVLNAGLSVISYVWLMNLNPKFPIRSRTLQVGEAKETTMAVEASLASPPMA